MAGKSKSATSILDEHYKELVEQLSNPIVVARLLLVEGLFVEENLEELEHKSPLSRQKDVFCKALKNAVDDDYRLLVIFATVLLKYKCTVSIGRTLLGECGKHYDYCIGKFDSSVLFTQLR